MRKFFVVIGVLLAAGCTSVPDEPAKAAGGQPWLDDTKAATAAGPIGATGSLCPMPVTFEVAKSWKPKAIENKGDDELGLARMGRFTAVCEVDAKPAGMIGFLRVWTDEDGGPQARAALEDFVADVRYAKQPEYRSVRLGSLAAEEVTYSLEAPQSDPKRERALAVPTPRGPVVLHVGGLDTEEHEQMLPAYVLAKQTLKVS
ncbi:lipoprotein [Actinocrispum sp. NPDC049592]|uniref:lipoprotein n=1 Tax=Actinocrispum sp. NPDC049592 TaxID=3154835 RepID=UPI00343A9346